MPWVRFTADFDDKPTRQVTVAFLDGGTHFVTKACAERAMAAGKAVPAKRPGAKDA